MNESARMSQHAADTVNGSIATSIWVSYLAGLSINEWAALAALVYSLMLIFDKLSPVPLRTLIVRVAVWCWRCVRREARRT